MAIENIITNLLSYLTWDNIISQTIRFKYIILFYLVIGIILYTYRKKIETQLKVIFLIRMKWGIKWMDKYSKKHRAWVVLLGYIGSGVGFIGLIVISYVLVKNLFLLMINPATNPGVSLVLPGINVPGLGILPFWHWLIAIFLIATVHEFSHGIVARAHNIEIKNTGIVFFGPIIGAFVEPNEKKMAKEKDIVQYSILAAGAFSNILLALVALLLLSFVTGPLQQTMVEPTGFTFDAFFGEDNAFENQNITPGTLITGIDDKQTLKFEEFQRKLQCKDPNETINVLTNQDNIMITLGQNPDNPDLPFLGISQIHNEIQIKEQYNHGIYKPIYFVLDTLNKFFRWLFLLSLGIGLFNLLPLPIVDGGRMTQTFLKTWKGEKQGNKYYNKIGMFFLLVLILSLTAPYVMKIFNMLF